MPIKIIKKCLEMQQVVRGLHREGKRIGFVPTMGFLHEGHLRLVDEVRRQSDSVVLSIFVNPTQFGAGEDLEKYPRDFDRDQKLARERGVDFLFAPEAHEMYPDQDQTVVLVTELTRGLCGPFRLGHFRGVTTVVAKLFLLVSPDIAVFGEKDFQQLAAVKRMVRDLHFPVEILSVPTVREPSGLALSSRNAYLQAGERNEAVNLSRAIGKAQEMVAAGERQVAKLLETVKALLGEGAHTQLEYAEIVDPESLEPLTEITGEARLVLAARVGSTRLIDNGALKTR